MPAGGDTARAKNYYRRPRRFYKRIADVVFAIYIAVVHPWSFSSDQWRL
jgi:hypothetical protein